MMTIVTLVISLLFAGAVSAQQLAFPTAEGFGRFTTGGRGNGSTGYVCHVINTGTTNTGTLLDGGVGPHREGTFRYCLLQSGPRTIVFDTSGTIDYNDQLEVLNNDMTIAGQTAPGEVVIKGTRLTIKGSHTIVRHLAVRAGPGPTVSSNRSYSSLVFDGTAGGVSHAIVDHSSITWSPDDIFQFWRVTDVTLQWSIVAEGLRVASITPTGDPETTNGKVGQLGGDGLVRGSMIHNLLMSVQDRSPQQLKKGTHTQVINNVIYNVTGGANYGPIGAPIVGEFIGNYFDRGPNSSVNPLSTTIRTFGYGWAGVSLADHNASELYLSGNFHDALRQNDSDPENSLVVRFGDTQALPYPSSRNPIFPFPNTTSAIQARSDVFLNVGVRVPVHPSVDARLINESSTGTGISAGGISNLDLLDYPTITPIARGSSFDTDGDGIPDTWEDTCGTALGGLSDTDKNDGNDIVTGIHTSVNGYSKLEVYLNELAGDYDAVGGVGSCAGLGTASDTTSPTGVAIIDPTESEVVFGTAQNLEATATDSESTITGVDFYQNGSLISSDTGAPDCSPNYCVTWDTTSIPDGDKTLYVIAISAGGQTQSGDVHVNVDNIQSYAAVHTGTPPTIDGAITEFSGANLIEFDAVAGNTTDCKMMYDSTNLYIGCTTTDTNLTGATTANDDSAVFGEDSLEIVLDPDNSNGSWTSSDYKIAINIQNARYDAHTQSNTAWSYGGSTSVALSGDIDGVADDTSWTVEAAIPWSSMSVTPSTSATYAINLQVNDKDGTASTVRYRWNGTSSNNLSDAMDVVLGDPPAGDTTDPVVSITQPSDGATIGGTYTIRADAQDASGIMDVQFYRDTSTAICSADTVAPFECAFDTTGISEGSHTFHAVARDNVSPTPNDATSATVTVTIDNTATSAPSGLSVTPSYDDIGYVMSINWGDVTDALSYQIERCDGASCSDFEVISTETSSDYFDAFLARNTEYCYRIRAFDIASNPSSYSSTVCDLTLDTILLDEPTTLSTNHSSTVTMLGSPETLSTDHSGTVTVLSAPDTLSTNHSGTPVFLGQPSNLGTP